LNKPSIDEPALAWEQPTVYLPTSGTDITGGSLARTWDGDGFAVVSHPALGNTFATQFPRRRFTSGGGAHADQELGAHCPQATAWRGNAASRGGFFFSSRFMVNAMPATDIRFFCGLSAGAAVCISNTPPANSLGLWCDTTDAGNLTILNVDSGGTAEKLALSSAQTLTVGTLYEFVIHCNPNQGGAATQLFNVGTGALLATQNPGAHMPLNTAFLAPQIGLSNAAHTAGGDYSLDVICVYLRPNLKLTPLGTP
jgi:hypothetical protein